MPKKFDQKVDIHFSENFLSEKHLPSLILITNEILYLQSFQISLLIACLIATVRGIDLFGDLIAFKEDIINGKCFCK